MKKYKIYPTLSSESIEGWVWTNDTDIQSNGFISIKNPLNGRSLRTFKRTIDENFIKIYNDSKITNKIETDELKIVMNEYHRNKLDLNKSDTVDLTIVKSSWFAKYFWNSWDHPNPYVSFSNKVTLYSFLITLVSLLVTIIALVKCK